MPRGRLVALLAGLGGLRDVGAMVGRRRLLDPRDVPGGIDRRDEPGDVHDRRVVADGRGLGCEVDVRLRDALDLVQEPGDPVDARRAGHPLHGERDDLDRLDGSGHRELLERVVGGCGSMRTRRRSATGLSRLCRSPLPLEASTIWIQPPYIPIEHEYPSGPRGHGRQVDLVLALLEDHRDAQRGDFEEDGACLRVLRVDDPPRGDPGADGHGLRLVPLEVLGRVEGLRLARRRDGPPAGRRRPPLRSGRGPGARTRRDAGRRSR